jgi:SNF2 family DNA or RNA helicase
LLRQSLGESGLTSRFHQTCKVKASQIKKELSVLKDASRAVHAEIKIGDTGLEALMLPYQKAGVAYASQAKRCFIADEMGLGKTLQAIATLEAVGSYPAVIMCPPNLVLNWKNEYKKWLPKRKVVVVTAGKGMKEDFPADGTYDVLVVGYSNITHWESRLKGNRAVCVR